MAPLKPKLHNNSDLNSLGRLTVKFSERTDDTLSNLAKSEEVSKTEILRRALSLYQYLTEQITMNEGYKVAIADREDKVIKEIVFTK